LKKIWWFIISGIVGGFILTLALLEILGDKEEELIPSDMNQLIYNLEERAYGNTYSASIDSEYIYISSDNKSYTYALPEDLFYISFAPYMTYTHECFTHSLTGCQGEMDNIDVYVIVYDDTGKIIKDEIMNTGDDGFIGLFLQKGIDYLVDIEYDGLKSSFETNPEQTCYAEVRLK
jgi:hypothetical protein